MTNSIWRNYFFFCRGPSVRVDFKTDFLIRVGYNMTHGPMALHPSISSNLFFDFRFLTCLMFFSHISWIINFQDENTQLFRLSPSQLWHLSVESFKVCQLFRGLFLTVMSGPSSIQDFSSHPFIWEKTVADIDKYSFILEEPRF